MTKACLSKVITFSRRTCKHTNISLVPLPFLYAVWSSCCSSSNFSLMVNNDHQQDFSSVNDQWDSPVIQALVFGLQTWTRLQNTNSYIFHSSCHWHVTQMLTHKPCSTTIPLGRVAVTNPAGSPSIPSDFPVLSCFTVCSTSEVVEVLVHHHEF